MNNHLNIVTNKITYRQLRDYLNKMSDYQLDCDVSVHDPEEDEYYEARLGVADANDIVLDEFHPIIGMLK